MAPKRRQSSQESRGRIRNREESPQELMHPQGERKIFDFKLFVQEDFIAETLHPQYMERVSTSDIILYRLQINTNAMQCILMIRCKSWTCPERLLWWSQTRSITSMKPCTMYWGGSWRSSPSSLKRGWRHLFPTQLIPLIWWFSSRKDS